jgi:cell wall-associated NlpC family hydrolase
VHTDTPQGVRPYGRTGAAALAALSVLATGGAVLGTPGIAHAASITVDTLIAAESSPAIARRAFVGPHLPVSTGPAMATQSELAADKMTILSGQSIVLVGRVTYGTGGKPFRGQPVRLEQGSGADWKTVGTALANADGSVTFTVKPATSTNYRLSYVGARAFAPSSSAVQSIGVKAPPPVVRRSPTTSSSSGWAPAGVSQIGSNGQTTGSGAAIVAAAAAQSGKPYIFGASGPNSFDCSGLTKFVYAQFGISLPHLANDQKGYGRPVSAADAAPGDLIFFLDGGYAYHVGIYAGGNQMIDAPRSGSTVGRHTIWSTNVTFRRLV